MLRNSVFLMILVGSLTSFCTGGVLSIGLSLLQLQDTTGETSATLNVINLIAIGIAGLCLGNVLARYQGFIIGFYSQIVCAGLLSFLLFINNPVLILLVFFLLALLMGADNPNNNSALNQLVPDPKQKASMFAFYTSCCQFFVIISPLLIYFIIAHLGHEMAIAFVVFIYLLNASLWFRINSIQQINRVKEPSKRPTQRAYGVGFRCLWRISALRFLTINRILNNFLYTGSIVLLPLVLASITSDNIKFTAIQNSIFALLALGFVVNGFVSSYYLRKSPSLIRFFVWGAPAFAIIAISSVLYLDFTKYSLYIMGFLLGVGQFYFRVSGITIGQAVTPSENLAEVILVGDASVRIITALFSIVLLYAANFFSFSILYKLCISIGFCAPLFILQGLFIYLKGLAIKKSVA
ncbi:MFS transporter [Bartonella taylorii]|uniref:MFS transporter n=1 Tax=Bartonella taylorii TaxID=33046 RepID=UPI001ABBA07C|nr:MFS transporter [Bartonella taylorii]